MDSLGLGPAQERGLALQQTQQAIQKLQDGHKSPNACAAISILPDDVLADVFVYCAPSWGTQRWHRPSLAFSHVCRHWRRVALDSPRVWSQIDFALPRLALVMLERAKDAPLSLKAETHFFSQDKVLQDVSGAIARKHANLKEVHLIGASSYLRQLLAQMTNPMPHLLVLKLVNEDPPRKHNDPRGQPNVELRCPALESVTSTRLRQLYISRLAIPWKSRCFGNLTELRILLESTTSLDISRLFDAIARNPLLKTLQLDIAGEWHPSDSDQSIESTILEHLTSLELTAATSLLIHTLHCFVFPKLRYLHVEPLGVCSTQSELASLVSALCERYTVPFDIRTVKFSDEQTIDDINIRLDVNEPRLFQALTGGHYVDLTFTGTFILAEDILGHLMGNESYLLKLCDSLRQVTECSILPSLQEDVWSAVGACISSLPSLQTLRVTGEPFHLILSLLENAEYGSASPRLFPSLNALLIETAPLDEDLENGEGNLETTGLRRFLGALKRRNEYVEDPFTVELIACDFQPEENPSQVVEEFGLSQWITVA